MTETQLILAAATAILVIAVTLRLRAVTVQEYEAGLLMQSGRFVRTLDAGRYWLFLPSTRIEVIDQREQTLQIAGQEAPTQDQVPVKLSALITYRVMDARTAVFSSDSYWNALYFAGQLALRSAAARFEFDEILSQRTALSQAFSEGLTEEAARLGLTVERAAVKDVMVGADLKRALGDVVKARAEGKAKLERARGESASLRNLANAARLLSEQNGLYQLRLLEAAQAAADGQGNTLVIGMDGDLDSLAKKRG